MNPDLQIYMGWLTDSAEEISQVIQKYPNHKNIATFNLLNKYTIDNKHKETNEQLQEFLHCIDTHKEDLNSFAILLFKASLSARNLQDISTGIRCFNLFKNFDFDKCHDSAKGLFALLYSTYYFEKDDCTDYLKVASEKIPKKSRYWYPAKHRYITSLILNNKPKNIEKEIKELSENIEHKHLYFPPEAVTASQYFHQNKPLKGFEALNNIKDLNKYKLNSNIILYEKLYLLFSAYKFKEGDDAINNLENKEEFLSKPYAKNLLVTKQLLANDIQNSREIINDNLNNANLTSLQNEDAQRLLLSIELIEGNIFAAERILEILDPIKNKIGMASYWVRLFILKNDFCRAAKHFNILIEQNTNYMQKFAFAHETKASDLQAVIVIASEIERHTSTENRTSNQPEEEDHSTLASSFESLIGTSDEMSRVKKEIQTYADQTTPVLIIGETGTGKEEVAKLLHNLSSRKDKPFIPINCGGIASTLMEAEFFGYKKGAFTGAAKDHPGIFESAGEGTVFLDEVSSMPLEMQKTLLRALESNMVRPVGGSKLIPIKARIIAATNENLEELIEQKIFRIDLFFRINRLTITLPALKNRTEDIPLLINYFMNKYFKNKNTKIDPELIHLFMNHSWPGNVRELKNEIERIAVLAGKETIITNKILNFKQINFAHQIGQKQDHASERAAETKAPIPTKEMPETQPKSAKINPESAEKPLLKYNELRLEKIKELFLAHKTLTRSFVIKQLSCSPNTATNDLRTLEAEGFIEKFTPTPSPRSVYFTLKE